MTQEPHSFPAVLKRRMQLKRMEIQMEEEIEWNFGYCPNDDYFNNLLGKRNKLCKVVKESDPEWWAVYDRYQAAAKCKKLMIF